MGAIITSDDLPTEIAANAMAEVWVNGANARASRVAPCLAADDPAPTDDQLADAKLILIGAVIRWSQAGSGALQSVSAMAFGATFDNRQRSGFNFWPSEIKQLQDICKSGESASAFSVDTVSYVAVHSPICSIYFGGSSCSCGADIAGQAIYE